MKTKKEVLSHFENQMPAKDFYALALYTLVEVGLDIRELLTPRNELGGTVNIEDCLNSATHPTLKQ